MKLKPASPQPASPQPSDSSPPDVGDDLADLAGQAAQLDAVDVGPDTLDQAPAPAPGPSNAELIAMGVEMFRELLCMVLDVETPKTTLDEKTARAIGQAWEPVCAKYSVDLGRLMGGFGPELAAIVTTGPLLFKAWRALDRELTEKRRPPARLPAADKGPPPAPTPPPPPTMSNVRAADFSPDARKPWDPELAARNAAAATPPPS